MPLTDATLAQAQAADAVLFGSVGGPKWEKLPFELQPERGLLQPAQGDGPLRQSAPGAVVFEALADASSLKRELVAGLDLLIVRELTGGIYFGDPRGIETLPDGTRRGINTEVYTEAEIERVVRAAFELARKRAEAALRGRQGQCHGIRHAVARGRQPGEARLSRCRARRSCTPTIARCSSCARQSSSTSSSPAICSATSCRDCAAMLTGSLGMLPSASLGAADATGRRKALYEPVHGSAPDIAGKDVANPLACILSFAMMLRYSFDLGDEADLVENAVRQALGAGVRTGDIRAASLPGIGPARWATPCSRNWQKTPEPLPRGGKNPVSFARQAGSPPLQHRGNVAMKRSVWPLAAVLLAAPSSSRPR